MCDPDKNLCSFLLEAVRRISGLGDRFGEESGVAVRWRVGEGEDASGWIVWSLVFYFHNSIHRLIERWIVEHVF